MSRIPSGYCPPRPSSAPATRGPAALGLGSFRARFERSGNARYPHESLKRQVFYPPYAEDPDRPTIVRVTNLAGAAVSRFNFGEPMRVSVKYPNGTFPNEDHPKFVLLRPASVTHHFDADQRYIELERTLESSPALNPRVYRVLAPQADLGPSGIYTLWAVRQRLTSAPPQDLLPSRLALVIHLED